MIRNLIDRSIDQCFEQNVLSLRAIHDVRRPQAKRKILGVFESQIRVGIKSLDVESIAMIRCSDFDSKSVVNPMNSRSQLVEKPRLSIDRHPESSPSSIHRSRPALDIAKLPGHSRRRGLLEEQAASRGQPTNAALVKLQQS